MYKMGSKSVMKNKNKPSNDDFSVKNKKLYNSLLVFKEHEHNIRSHLRSLNKQRYKTLNMVASNVGSVSDKQARAISYAIDELLEVYLLLDPAQHHGADRITLISETKTTKKYTSPYAITQLMWRRHAHPLPKMLLSFRGLAFADPTDLQL